MLWDRREWIIGYDAIASALGISRITLVRRLKERKIALTRWRAGLGRNSPCCVRLEDISFLKNRIFSVK